MTACDKSSNRKAGAVRSSGAVAAQEWQGAVNAGLGGLKEAHAGRRGHVVAVTECLF